MHRQKKDNLVKYCSLLHIYWITLDIRKLTRDICDWKHVYDELFIQKMY